MQQNREQILVLAGPRGCGKSTTAIEMAKAHGEFSTISAANLNDEFTFGDALSKKPKTLIVEGTPNAHGLDKLKSLVANATVTCERQYRKPTTVKSPARVIVCADADSALIRDDAMLSYNAV